MEIKTPIPTFDDVKEARVRIKDYAIKTPVLTSEQINAIAESEIYFKCENFQKVGAFKYRGASNAVLSLSERELEKGVATHSSGNHAQALALAARNVGAAAYVVMPNNSLKVKKEAVAGYGAKIYYCEPSLEARERNLGKVIERTGATFIHPYDNFNVVCGQGTAALELFEQAPKLDALIVPVGGGGLLGGSLISAKAVSPETKVIAAEPEGADDAYRSLEAGEIIPSVNPQTVADGLLTSLSELTFEIIKSKVSRIVTVGDAAIIQAMKLIWERMKIIVEPSAAITLGLLLENKIDLTDKKIGAILSGGNVDLDNLPRG